MKVTALLLCLALVPFVAAQAPEVPDESPGFIGYISNAWNEFIGGNIDAQRYREDFSARVDEIRNRCQAALNNTLQALRDLSLDSADLPTVDEIDEAIANLGVRFDNFQTNLEAQLNDLKERVQNFDPFDVLEQEEEEAVVEPEPEPFDEPEPTEEQPWWAFW